MMLPSVTLTEAAGFGRLYKESGSVSATPVLAIAAPTRAVATLSGGGFGGNLRRPFTVGWWAEVAIRSGFRAEEEHGEAD